MEENTEPVFFWGHNPKNGLISSLSNWYECTFTDKVNTYTSSEQYMMYQKAILFNDTENAQKIMNAKTPKEAKSLGRKVKNFDKSIWDENACKIVYDGCLLKFTQNVELGQFILSTDNKLIVEASPYDQIWGIGLSAANAKKIPQNEWPGTNWLGKCLMNVRNSLK